MRIVLISTYTHAWSNLRVQGPFVRVSTRRVASNMCSCHLHVMPTTSIYLVISYACCDSISTLNGACLYPVLALSLPFLNPVSLPFLHLFWPCFNPVLTLSLPFLDPVSTLFQPCFDLILRAGMLVSTWRRVKTGSRKCQSRPNRPGSKQV